MVIPLTALAASLSIGVQLSPGEAMLFLGGGVVAAMGLADDRWGLSVPLRFGAYLIAATMLAAGGVYLHELQWPGAPSIPLGWLGIPVTLLWVVGLTNAYNFMDGIDGIAAVQAVVAAIAVSILALWQGNLVIAVFAGVLAAGVLGFLPHNWPPATVFMGDVGSAYLGYTFAGLAVVSTNETDGSFPFAVWPILLAPFLFDTSFTLLQRVARGERWYEAHREHLYQRLVRSGWPHRAVTLTYLCADLFLALIAGALFAHRLAGAGLALAVLLPLVGIFLLVKGVERWSVGPQPHDAVPN